MPDAQPATEAAGTPTAEPTASSAPPPASEFDAPEDAATPAAGDAVAEAPAATDADESDEFALELPVFQGPLELLLHLIEREELDITEVSLVAVTEQYLQHLRAGDRLELGALSSFISVGARLLLLKSRALLPRDEDDELGGDEGDERDPDALLAALREYRRYRAAAEHLRSLEDEHRTGYRREVPPPEVPPGTGLDGVTAQTLFELFREVLERLPEEEPEPEVRRDPVRLAERMGRLVQRLERDSRLAFRELIAGATTRVVVIVDFLAVLELIRRGYVEAQQSGTFGEIELVRITGATPPSAAEVEDDMPGL